MYRRVAAQIAIFHLLQLDIKIYEAVLFRVDEGEVLNVSSFNQIDIVAQM
ncbi:MAG: hypothetical protein NT092_04835 [Bacteroidia bacterium]|nr:hypothetical protein [Bacteroidia bacterium]